MITKDLDDVLSLLGVTIIADKRVFSAEIEAFLKAAKDLKLARLIDPKLSEARLLAWYEMNKDDLTEKVHSPYFKTWFYDCLDSLADLPDKSALLKAMGDISLSDGELHVSERALIVLAKLHWKMDP